MELVEYDITTIVGWNDRELFECWRYYVYQEMNYRLKSHLKTLAVFKVLRSIVEREILERGLEVPKNEK